MLNDVRDVLIDAVLAGAAEVLAVRTRGSIGAGYKDATELVTEADRRSDSAMLAVFRTKLTAIDPEISFVLEESGESGGATRKRACADPLDGTTHFTAGGNLYSVQAHYAEDGVPLVGVVFQPEVYLPLLETDRPAGRLVSAVLGQGAVARRTELVDGRFQLSAARSIRKPSLPATRTYIGCVPITSKMKPDEKRLAQRVYDSGILGGMTGTGNAGGNILMLVYGGHQVYCNFGSGDELDLAPGQVVAQEAGLTVWSTDRRPPVWHARKQPFVASIDEAVAERFLSAAGL
jgi:3'-phosphoadenosine 5'-phosphosulfate (PAPS) 3'-phosphatase